MRLTVRARLRPGIRRGVPALQNPLLHRPRRGSLHAIPPFVREDPDTKCNLAGTVSPKDHRDGRGNSGELHKSWAFTA